VDVQHLHATRTDLGSVAGAARQFSPDVIVDSFALTAADVDAAAGLPDVPAVVLSSQDVYQAFTALRAGRCDSAVPLSEDAELRRERYPYKGSGTSRVPEDYDKIDVEERWLARGAVVLRLPMVYGPHDEQRREDPILQRVRAGRTAIPVGGGTLLWTRAHVDDVASAVLAAIDTRAGDGMALNIGESTTVPIGVWYQQILDAAGSEAELVRVPDAAVPEDLALSTSHLQHILVSVERARDVLGWQAGDPVQRVSQSVSWHLEHPAPGGWDSGRDRSDDVALAGAFTNSSTK
jgi:nucleoside-diphosphate-sugar epimerase